MLLLNRLSRIYLGAWLAATFALTWLPFVRSIFDGSTYLWNTGHFGVRFSGAGLHGDFWFLVMKVAVAIAAIFGVCRLWRPGLYLAGGLVAFYLLDTAVLYAEDPSSMVLRGDTLGIDVNIGLVALTLNAIGIGAIGALIATRSANEPYRPLQTHNWRLLYALVALAPIQLVLLRFGEVPGLTDVLGVLLTLVQWFLLPLALLRDTRQPETR